MTRRLGRFQFTIGTLLIITTVFAPVMSYVASVLRQHEITEEIARCVNDYKARITFDTDHGVGDPVDVGTPGAPFSRWIFGSAVSRRVTGIGVTSRSLSRADLSLFGEAKGIRWLALESCSFDEDAFLSLPELPELKYLDLIGHELSTREVQQLVRFPSIRYLCISVSDSALAKVGSLKELEVMYVCGDELRGVGMPVAPLFPRLRAFHAEGTKWNDAGVERLVTHGSIEEIGFSGHALSEKGFALLAMLPKLRTLMLFGCSASDGSMEQIAKMRALESLKLWDMEVTNSRLSRLAGAGDIVSLDLTRARISDAAVAHLLRLRKLRTLSLFGTGVTDAGVEKLAELPALVVLDVQGTKVTEAGAKKLKALSKTLRLVVRTPSPQI